MNVFFVRTKLQALIVEKIISREEMLPYVFVVNHFDSRVEDSGSVYKAYEKIKSGSVFSFDIVSSDGFFLNLAKYYFLILLSFITSGKVFLAGIDNYQFATAVKFFPFCQLATFDDGSANFLKSSKYFSESAPAGRGVKKKLLAKVFPSGCASYLRKKILLHYTIFPSKENIVEKERLRIIEWDWTKLLEYNDKEILECEAKVIMIGTPFQDEKNGDRLIEIARKKIVGVDLYFAHPREKNIIESENFFRLCSPAESALLFLAKANKIQVYHFDSTVAYSLEGHPNIEFIDLSAY